MDDEPPGGAPATRPATPGLEGLPVLDTAHLARQTSGDRDLQRELLALFDAQCDRLLADIAGPSARNAAFAAHTLKGAANAIGAVRVATLAERIDEALAAGTGAGGLVARLFDATGEARAAIAGELGRS